MSVHTLKQRHALRYATLKAEGDREVQAQSESSVTSSMPTLQRFFESPRGVLLMLYVGLVIFALFAPVGSW